MAYHHLPDFGEHASVRDLERRMYNLLWSEQIDVFVQFGMVLECSIWQSISCAVYRDWLLIPLRKHVTIWQSLTRIWMFWYAAWLIQNGVCSRNWALKSLKLGIVDFMIWIGINWVQYGIGRGWWGCSLWGGSWQLLICMKIEVGVHTWSMSWWMFMMFAVGCISHFLGLEENMLMHVVWFERIILTKHPCRYPQRLATTSQLQHQCFQWHIDASKIWYAVLYPYTSLLGL